MFGLHRKVKRIEVPLQDLAHIWLQNEPDSQISRKKLIDQKFKFSETRQFWDNIIVPEIKKLKGFSSEEIILVSDLLHHLELAGASKKVINTEEGEVDLLKHSLEIASLMANQSEQQLLCAAMIVGLSHNLGAVIDTGSALPKKASEAQRLYWWVSKRVKEIPNAREILNALNPEIEHLSKSDLTALMERVHQQDRKKTERETEQLNNVAECCKPNCLNYCTLKKAIEEALSYKNFEAFVWEGSLYLSPDKLKAIIAEHLDKGEIVDIPRVKAQLIRVLPETLVINGNYRLKYADHNKKPEKKYYFVLIPNALNLEMLSSDTPRDDKGRWLRKIELIKEIDRFDTQGDI